MNDIKAQIKALSGQAAQLSQKAIIANRRAEFISREAVDGTGRTSFYRLPTADPEIQGAGWGELIFSPSLPSTLPSGMDSVGLLAVEVIRIGEGVNKRFGVVPSC